MPKTFPFEFQEMRPVSIIIPVHEGGRNFPACLDSLKALNPAPMETIVVVDGDDQISVVAARKFGARVFQCPIRSGPAAARNSGARWAKGEILFFVDADVAVHSDTLTRIENAFLSDPGLAAVIGSYDDSPLESTFLSQFRNLLHHHIHQNAGDDASTFWGACGAIRGEVFLSLGGFNEKAYRAPSIEDIDLGYRLKRAGHRIRLVKQLQVKHLKRWNLGKTLKADVLYRAVPWTALILKERRILNDLNVSLFERTNLVFTYFILLGLAGGIANLWFTALSIYSGSVLAWRNRPFYAMIFHIHGFVFLIKGILFHWFYYLYCGVGFFLGLCISYADLETVSNRSLHKKVPTNG